MDFGKCKRIKNVIKFSGAGVKTTKLAPLLKQNSYDVPDQDPNDSLKRVAYVAEMFSVYTGEDTVL